MDGNSPDRAFGEAIIALVVFTAMTSCVVTALVVGCTVWMLTPTEESKERESKRQAIIERLTPEERDALGVR